LIRLHRFGYGWRFLKGVNLGGWGNWGKGFSRFTWSDLFPDSSLRNGVGKVILGYWIAVRWVGGKDLCDCADFTPMEGRYSNSSGHVVRSARIALLISDELFVSPRKSFIHHISNSGGTNGLESELINL
jgi:hypothetical protein